MRSRTSPTRGAFGVAGLPRTTTMTRPSTSRSGSPVTSRTRNRVTIWPMNPSAGRTLTVLAVAPAVPAPGVSTVAPTTAIGSGANGLNAPSSTSTVRSAPSTPSIDDPVHHGTVRRVLAITRSADRRSRASRCGRTRSGARACRCGPWGRLVGGDPQDAVLVDPAGEPGRHGRSAGSCTGPRRRRALGTDGERPEVDRARVLAGRHVDRRRRERRRVVVDREHGDLQRDQRRSAPRCPPGRRRR